MPKTRRHDLGKHRGHKSRKTRKASKRSKGGSRREMNLYKSPAEMRADMDFFLVSAHGTTTTDDYFFTVPDNTYMVFTTPSGTLAPGEFKDLDELEVAGANKNAYYQTLYDRMFTPGGSKYPGESFIYEPGDLIPDYNLSFRNNGFFFAKMGVYELPFANPLPGVTGDYYGRTVAFIKRLLDAGMLTEADVSHLTGQIATDLKTKSVEEIEKTYYTEVFKDIVAPDLIFWDDREKKIMEALNESNRWNKTHLNREPVPYEELPLLSKLEHYSTFTDDNLIKELLLPSRKYGSRLSVILNMVNPHPEKKRFFFMSFCRVSVEDILSKYEVVRSKPKLLRALSFSQKCSVGNEDKVINFKKLVDTFAKYPLETRRDFIALPAGRRFTVLLKKLIKADWSKYLEGTYTGFNGSDRIDMMSPYVGRITPEDLNELANLHKDLSAFPEIAKPLQEFDSQIDKYDESLKHIADEKKTTIQQIYDIIHKTTGYGKITGTLKNKKTGEKISVSRIDDFLHLEYVHVDKVKRLLTRLNEPDFIAMIVPKPKAKANANNNAYNKNENDGKNNVKFMLYNYSGPENPYTSDYNIFPQIEEPDKSITFNDLGNSNNENEEDNQHSVKSGSNSNNSNNNSNSTKSASVVVVSNSNNGSNSEHTNVVSLYRAQTVANAAKAQANAAAKAQANAAAKAQANAAAKAQPRHAWENNNYAL